MVTSLECNAVGNITSEPVLYDAMSSFHKDCLNHQLGPVQGLLAHPGLLSLLFGRRLGRVPVWQQTIGLLDR